MKKLAKIVLLLGIKDCTLRTRSLQSKRSIFEGVHNISKTFGSGIQLVIDIVLENGEVHSLALVGSCAPHLEWTPLQKLLTLIKENY